MNPNKKENVKEKVQVEIAPDHTSCNQLVGWMEVQVERNVSKVYFHACISNTLVVSTQWEVCSRATPCLEPLRGRNRV